MQCNCRSKDLYRKYEDLTFKVDNVQLTQSRKPIKQIPKPQNAKILQSIYESSQVYLPTRVDKIFMQQIYASPLWFYKNYIGLNKPCIIEGVIDQDVIDKLSNPKQFLQILQKIPEVSVSLTPDGFADSIKNQYFIQPLQQKFKIKDLIDWKEKQSQNNRIKSHWIPYIQHQNSNLTTQFNELTQYIDQDAKNFIGLHYFQGNQPDASNFWMGFQDSVSALHKDPYQNFYTAISGQKHFTLMPPVSIAHMYQEQFITSQWKIGADNSTLEAFSSKNKQYETTRWIYCNPDLQTDYQLFPQLTQLKQYTHHIILQSGQTLYLPSLWYHQVSQTHQKSPYTIAINYWFDMSFSHNYSLYEAVRKLKGYP